RLSHMFLYLLFFFSSRRRHTRCYRDWSSDVCSSDLQQLLGVLAELSPEFGQLYSRVGRPSIAPEKLLRALLLQVLYTVRSERLRSEERRVGKECRARGSADDYQREWRGGHRW